MMKQYINIHRRLFIPFFVIIGAIVLSNCDDNDGQGWADERYLSNFEHYFDNPNPKTGLAYTQAEIDELKYDRTKEERFKGEQPVVLNLVLSKQINSVEVMDGTNGEILLTFNSAETSGDKFKLSMTTSLAELEIGPGSSKALKFNIVYADGSIGTAFFIVASVLPLPPAADILVGQWEFDDASNLGKATIGTDLVPKDKDGGSGSHSATSGMASGDGAVLTASGSYFELVHNLSATLGGNKVNNYTLVFDVSVPSSSYGSYSNLFHTRLNIEGDGSTYISPSGGLWGRGIGSSGGGAIQANSWHRIVITVGDGDYRAYIDGQRILVGSSGLDDPNHALDLSKVLLFIDNGSEDVPIKVTEVMLFNRTFDNNWVTEDLPPVGQPVP
ncbi:hypothetical protein [Snuella sedimenti]|uniref:Uncharacterized protein n=1 Tax=Snuella sedimenti TaxID=2798802 RepID=A0A8J7LYS9_9FLAO|nr:hypothetical protein [Snuella sedimenti]MBJ6368936.1 hypothetical protein [Snuella sedimenti]